MNCIDLTSERSKMLRYIAKLQKWSYYDEFASIWRENASKMFSYSQNIQNNAKLQKWSNYNACINLTSKRSKELSYVPKLQKWSNYNELHRFDITSQNYKSDQITMNSIDLTLLRKTFKTTQNYKSNQITMDCIDFTSKQSKMLSYVVKHSKLRKTESHQITMNFID